MGLLLFSSVDTSKGLILVIYNWSVWKYLKAWIHSETLERVKRPSLSLWRIKPHLACDIAEFNEEVGRGVVVSSLGLDGLDHNTSHWFALLPPLYNEILHLSRHVYSSY